MSSDFQKTGFLKGEKDDSGEMFKVKLNVQQDVTPGTSGSPKMQ